MAALRCGLRARCARGPHGEPRTHSEESPTATPLPLGAHPHCQVRRPGHLQGAPSPAWLAVPRRHDGKLQPRANLTINQQARLHAPNRRERYFGRWRKTPAAEHSPREQHGHHAEQRAQDSWMFKNAPEAANGQEHERAVRDERPTHRCADPCLGRNAAKAFARQNDVGSGDGARAGLGPEHPRARTSPLGKPTGQCVGTHAGGAHAGRGLPHHG